MIVNATRTISYKCPFCGTFVFGDFSIFDIYEDQALYVECSCNNSSAVISRPNKGYLFEIPCITCDDNHKIHVAFKELWATGELYLSCPENHFHIACIGEYETVNSWADEYDLNMDFILTELGYEDYFADDEIMLEAIDHIHDIAENKNLYCNCGNSNIEMELLYDSIALLCPSCRAEKIIPAKNKEDLDELNKKEKIILRSKKPKNNNQKIISLNSIKD